VIDYSSPNTAKQMHVGHLRSLVIGESLQRIVRFHGANIIRDNHLGDWGTQFGILLMQIKAENYDLTSQSTQDPIEDLEGLYKRGSERFKTDALAQEIAREELTKLQNNDPINKNLWKGITNISYKTFDKIYKDFDVTFDQIQGESFYNDQLNRVYNELTELNIACISEKALVVFHPEHPRFSETPFIIRKADGASNYGSTDLATALYHTEKAHADVLLYVVDARQNDHFDQLFLTIQKWFKAKNYPLPQLKHISFGTVLGEDGKAIKTRSGESIKLKDLINEAKDRALAIVQSKSPDMPLAEQTHIAKIIGIGALKYADLSQNRSSDYLFSWDKMLSLEGNTAPYLLYAVARIHSILEKAPAEACDSQIPCEVFDTVQENHLARHLMLFPSVLQIALEDLRPHPLCTYLYELAGYFSTFYATDKILIDDPIIRNRRLLLAKQTLLILETGLDLLGVQSLKKM
jgi:arginyl-tRNA synthetase